MAIKLHTLFDLKGNIPLLINTSKGKTLHLIPLESSDFYAIDRGYVDFQRLYSINVIAVLFSLAPKLTSILKGSNSTINNKKDLSVFKEQIQSVGDDTGSPVVSQMLEGRTHYLKDLNKISCNQRNKVQPKLSVENRPN